MGSWYFTADELMRLGITYRRWGRCAAPAQSRGDQSRAPCAYFQGFVSVEK